jgi:hypothetical protein
VKVFVSSLKKEALVEALDSGKRSFDCKHSPVIEPEYPF